MEVYLGAERSLGLNPTIQVCKRNLEVSKIKKKHNASNAWQGLVAAGELIRKGMRSKYIMGMIFFVLERSLVRKFSLNQSHVEGDKFGRFF